MSYESRLKQEMDWKSMLATKEREGREKGRQEGKREIIENLIVEKDWSDEEIAEISSVSAAFVRQIRKTLLSR